MCVWLPQVHSLGHIQRYGGLCSVSDTSLFPFGINSLYNLWFNYVFVSYCWRHLSRVTLSKQVLVIFRPCQCSDVVTVHSFISLNHLTGDGSLCPSYYSITGCVPCDISGESCVDFQLLHPRMARPATWTFPLRPVVGAVTSSCLDSQMQCHVGRSDFWKSSYVTKHRMTSSRDLVTNTFLASPVYDSGNS